MNTFELNDKQRIYFGLDPINSNWDRIAFNNGAICYFENDTIKKVIISDGDGVEQYVEFDTTIPTNQRTKIISKTGKGKEKTISPTTLNDYRLKHVEVSAQFYDTTNTSMNHNVQLSWEIGKQNLNLKDHVPGFKDLTDISKFGAFVDEFITSVPENHLKIIQQLKIKKTPKLKPVKFKVGDFFAVPVKRDLYGNPIEYTFGRVMLNISDLRKGGIVDKEHHFYDLGTIVQLVTLYDFNSDVLLQDLEQLKSKSTIPGDYMMDDQLMRGHYPIIGHLPMTAGELNFPIHYGTYVRSSRSGYYFGWGMAMVDGVAKLQSEGQDLGCTFRNNGVAFGANTYLQRLLRDGEPPFYVLSDLNHPKHTALKTQVFKAMGVDPDISYDDFCKKFGAPDRQALLEKIK